METFPVLLQGRSQRNCIAMGCPDTVPLSLLNEEWAERNHRQSLTRLAQRGGLGPIELLANMDRMDWADAEAKWKSNEIAAQELVRRMLSWRHPAL